MGRIADTLEGAEQQRLGNVPRSVALTDPLLKWSNWYGTAKPREMETVSTDRAAVPGGPPVAGMSEQIVCYYERSSLKSEQYRSFRTRLISANPRQEHRIYAISSTAPKEGKSITAVNLGFCLAEIPHLKVLIVDGDFRQSTVADLLAVDATPGLADLLQGQASYDQVIQSTPVPNLSVVSAGKMRGHAATDLLSRRTARDAFARFGRDYHYTIVDTPPATTVADVGILGQLTSGVIFVIRMHRTPEPLARRAIKHITSNNIAIVGGLLIGEDDPSSGYGRHFNYYRYYSDDPR